MGLFQFAWFHPDMESVLSELAGMAMNEQWHYQHTNSQSNYPILWNYLDHTFSRLKAEGKIVEEGEYATFNTGLATDHQEEIFAFFNTNQMRGADIPWFFKGFRKESSRDLMRFSVLPIVQTILMILRNSYMTRGWNYGSITTILFMIICSAFLLNCNQYPIIN